MGTGLKHCPAAAKSAAFHFGHEFPNPAVILGVRQPTEDTCFTSHPSKSEVYMLCPKVP